MTTSTKENFRYSPWHEMPDVEVWNNFRKGSWPALEYIYRTYTKDLFSYGMKIKANDILVEDAIQELFIELWNSRERLAGTEKIKFYLLKALKWKIVHLIKREQKIYVEQIPAEIPEVEIIISHESRLINHQLSEERKAHLYACMDKLTQRQKETLQLLFVENLSYKETARIMNIRVKSLYVFASRALYALRKNLKHSGVRLFVSLGGFLIN